MTRSADGHPLLEEQAAVMRLEVFRFSSGVDDTLGIIFDVTDGGRRFLCFSLEDEYRDEKVHSETRIPAGTYELKLRTEGGFHARYAKKFPDIHEGMIHVQDVPFFKYILWHVGNDAQDTAGCLLLGDQSRQNVTGDGFIGASRDAYRRVYPRVRDAIKTGRVLVEYVDAEYVRGSPWVVDAGGWSE